MKYLGMKRVCLIALSILAMVLAGCAVVIPDENGDYESVGRSAFKEPGKGVVIVLLPMISNGDNAPAGGSGPNQPFTSEVDAARQKDSKPSTPISGDDCSPCDGKVNYMVVRYDGASTADVQIMSRNKELYSGSVAPGESIALDGADFRIDQQRTLGTEVGFYVNGSKVGSMHTSCSVPFSLGTTAGDFVVIDATSRNGGQMCQVAPISGTPTPIPPTPVPPTPVPTVPVLPEPTVYAGSGEPPTPVPPTPVPPTPTATPFPSGQCKPCNGKVDFAVLSYDGTSTVDVQIVGRGGAEFFSGSVDPGDFIELDGASFSVDRQRTLGTEIVLYVDGSKVGSMHTSCSQPFGPGLSAGDFTVAFATSRNGGIMCELP